MNKEEAVRKLYRRAWAEALLAILLVLLAWSSGTLYAFPFLFSLTALALHLQKMQSRIYELELRDDIEVVT